MSIYKWAALGVAIAALVAAAQIARYEVIPNRLFDGQTVLWDRWLHRICIVTHSGEIVCSKPADE